MKSTLVMLCLLPVMGLTQIEIKDQPGAEWYSVVWTKHQRCTMSKESLLAMKRDFNLATFQDTLRYYDWVELGGYLYVDKAMTSGYGEQKPTYQIIRLDEADTVLNFSYNATYAQMDKGTISHTNFVGTLGMHPVWKLKNINGKWFLHDAINNEYLHLIHYSNGMLIYDTPMNGKATDSRFFSRKILMAIPRAFSWSKISN